tara:strand:+ start:11706 stop:12671 length:966 start_codon:yes stop_codon:yes gene_type:complete
MKETKIREAVVPEDYVGWRLDKVLPILFEPYSRSQLQEWLQDGRLTIEGEIPSKSGVVKGGEHIFLRIPVDISQNWLPQCLPLNIVHKDQHIAIIDKPAGLVVHPGSGNPDSTLANAILHYFPENQFLIRAGIVHRLDKGTTGLLVVARTEVARQRLIKDLESRAIKRQYLALVYGRPIAGGTLDSPIGRHPRDRRRMAVSDKGKLAVTHFRLEKRYRFHTLLRIHLETGRTHQIRVHLADARLPIVGDPVYGGRLRMPRGADTELTTLLRNFNRQALHATELSLTHPTTGSQLTWKSNLPGDFDNLVSALDKHEKINERY